MVIRIGKDGTETTIEKTEKVTQVSLFDAEPEIVKPDSLKHDCHACHLRDLATQVVWAHGTERRIVIVGEAPGETEDKKGIPFIGESGKLVRKAIGHNDFLITNIVKCRPPGNATPTKQEAMTCATQHIEDDLKDAQLIYLLGNTAQLLEILRPDLLKGKIVQHRTHPSHALRKHYEEKWVQEFSNSIRWWVLSLFDAEEAYIINSKM